ncbi:MAG: MFS transporter [Candidatus Peribacteraceae bacterium]|nr:MFS transporter [Candidatus Peribacteraceae bacterium]MDD5074301.1 MFS transporter [Candidatus Peribacteraceae bacterium]
MEAVRHALIRRNILKLYALQALQGAIVLIPVLIPFYQSNGIPLTQVYLLEAIFSIQVLLLEIPTGYIADRWGRRNTLIAATFFWCSGWICYAAGHSFGTFMIGELLMGLGVSLYSGTIEAMTYDSLLEMGETDRYRRVAGHQAFLTFITEAGASILGGFIAFWSLRAAAWTTAGMILVAFLISLTLVEPRRHKQLEEKEHLRALRRTITHTLVENIPLRSIIVLHSIIATMTLCLFWFTQPYQMAVGLPVEFFGIAHAVIVTAGAFASRETHRLAQRIDDRLFLLLIAFAVVLCYAALGAVTALWGISFFLIGRIAWGFLSPLTSDMVNRMTTSDVRATVLSIRAMGSRILFACSIPFFGLIADRSGSLSPVFFLMVIIGGMSLSCVFLLMQPVWERIPE